MLKYSRFKSKPFSNKMIHKCEFPFHFHIPNDLPSHPIVRFFMVLFFWSLILINAVILPVSVWAWERSTHQELTEEAIKVIEPGLNAYLMNTLGLEGGLDASVEGGTPRNLIIQGSSDEDDFPRFVNHFHEPIGNRGLGKFGGISSINWALKEIGTQEGENSYSWKDGREYFLKALTSPSKTERDKFWGKTFRVLGQVMHLIQDSANPSHVRDDIHPTLIDDDGLHDYMARQSVNNYFTGGGLFGPDHSLLETPHSHGPPDPLANLFDANTYNGNNPTATLGTNVGVTEYTSANFFSDDTIPGQSRTFLPLFPNAFELVPAPIPLPYLTLPRLGRASFPAARAAKLTANQSAAQFLLTHTHFDLIGKLELDNVVYDAQAKSLIPRAVDYSVAILNYFFRGELAITYQTYSIRGQNIGGPFCNETPADEFGALDVWGEIPANLNFEGTVSLYYDRPDKTRVFLDRVDFDPSSGREFFLGGVLHHTEIPRPVRLHVVLDGGAGPGTQESRAVVAKASVAEWEFLCVH